MNQKETAGFVEKSRGEDTKGSEFAKSSFARNLKEGQRGEKRKPGSCGMTLIPALSIGSSLHAQGIVETSLPGKEVAYKKHKSNKHFGK